MSVLIEKERSSTSRIINYWSCFPFLQFFYLVSSSFITIFPAISSPQTVIWPAEFNELPSKLFISRRGRCYETDDRNINRLRSWRLTWNDLALAGRGLAGETDWLRPLLVGWEPHIWYNLLMIQVSGSGGRMVYGDLTGYHLYVPFVYSLSVCMFVCLSVGLSVRLSIGRVVRPSVSRPFHVLFLLSNFFLAAHQLGQPLIFIISTLICLSSTSKSIHTHRRLLGNPFKQSNSLTPHTTPTRPINSALLPLTLNTERQILRLTNSRSRGTLDVEILGRKSLSKFRF